MIQKRLRTYFNGKTDEVIIDDYSWRTNHFDYSAMISYKYADEQPEKNAPECSKRIEKLSTCYNHVGDIGIYNVFDAEPFPDGYDRKKKWKDWNGGRNGYITMQNLNFYLQLAKNAKAGTISDFTQNLDENQKKQLEAFEKNGVVVKDGGLIIPMIPVIPREVVEKGEIIVYKALMPIVKEIAENAGEKIEKILLPCLGDVKTRKDHFYSFWLAEFLNPKEELFWYGMNVDGLEIPEDYNKSVAGMWITY